MYLPPSFRKMTFKANPNFDKFPIMEEKATKTAVTFEEHCEKMKAEHEKMMIVYLL
jgi:hypothetical protein